MLNSKKEQKEIPGKQEKIRIENLNFKYKKRVNMNKKKLEELTKKSEEFYEFEEKTPDKIREFKKNPESDPLDDFIVEVVGERLDQNLSQEDLAKKMKTTQSVISRFENMGRKPSFEFMQRLAEALGGKLHLTIHGDYTLTASKEHREQLDLLSEQKNRSPKEILEEFLEQGFKRMTFPDVIPTAKLWIPRATSYVVFDANLSVQEEYEKQSAYWPSSAAKEAS